MEPNQEPEPDLPIEAALADLVWQLRPRIRQVFSNFRIPAFDAEDVLQEVLVIAFLKWDSIRIKDAWLLGTLRKKCALYWKRQRDDRLQGVDFGTLEELCRPVEPGQERIERRLDLAALTSGLCRRHRLVLWLRYGLGLSASEIAARTGYCDSSIRKLTCRSVARLQKKLGK